MNATMRDDSITDVTLMALADGELEEARVAEIRFRIALEPELARRFALFAETRALAAGAQPLARDVAAPDRLVAAILRADAAANADMRQPVDGPSSYARFGVIEGGGAGAKPVSSPASRRSWSTRAALPFAASVALLIGAAFGWTLGIRTGPLPGGSGLGVVPSAAASAVTAALDRLPSGETVAWSDPAIRARGTVAMISSHKTDDNGFCREYDITVEAPKKARTTGVSCRRNGTWRAELALARPVPDESGFAPASGGSEIVDQFLAQIGGAGTLSATEERKLLQH